MENPSGMQGTVCPGFTPFTRHPQKLEESVANATFRKPVEVELGILELSATAGVFGKSLHPHVRRNIRRTTLNRQPLALLQFPSQDPQPSAMELIHIFHQFDLKISQPS